MTLLDNYLKDNRITQATIAKLMNKPSSSVAAIINSKVDITEQNNIKAIRAIADILGKTPGDILNELIKLEGLSMAFNEEHTFTILTTIWNDDDSLFSDEVYEYDEFEEACAAFEDLIKINRLDEKTTFDLSVDDDIVMSITLQNKDEITDKYMDNLNLLPSEIKPALLKVAQKYEISVD